MFNSHEVLTKRFGVGERGRKYLFFIGFSRFWAQEVRKYQLFIGISRIWAARESKILGFHWFFKDLHCSFSMISAGVFDDFSFYVGRKVWSHVDFGVSA